jgi:hypothetical protein
MGELGEGAVGCGAVKEVGGPLARFEARRISSTDEVGAA